MSTTCPRCGNRAIRRGGTSRPGRHRFQCTTRGCPTNYFTSGGEGNRPNVLSIDIEILPPVYYSWSPHADYLGRQMLIKDWALLSYAAKWVGDDKIISSVLTPEEAIARDDYRLASEINMLLDQAHVAVAHNGKRYDFKKINARFWKHGLHRPSQYRVIDTLSVARSVFGLTYSTLDYIAEFKERDQKLHTSMQLWIDADHGDPDALQKMLEYNDQDVITQEQIYLDMREWIPNHPNLAVISQTGGCPVCLHKGYKKIGFYYTNKKKYQEYRCNSCHAIWHSSKAVK